VRHGLNGGCNEQKGAVCTVPFSYSERVSIEKLNFYTVDLDYVNYLKKAEQDKRGFSRVPNMEYGNLRKPKFLCGIVLQVNNIDYYVPVTSYTQQKPDNFLIKADNGQVTSSLRFNYMFPIPKELVAERTIAGEPDRAYRALLAQELKYCITNQETIQHLAERTYKRVLLGKDQGLVANSCAFQLLEQECKTYLISPEKKTAKAAPIKASMKERMAAAQAEADRRSQQTTDQQHRPDKSTPER
jgi:protein AbiQ